MAVSSTMLKLGTPAPHFSLPDVTTGLQVRLDDFAKDKALLVVFLCAHCPYVHHVQTELAKLARDYTARSVAIVGITSNDIEQYPQDSPKETARFAAAAGFTFPILYDASQAVAKAYSAACTPDFFLFNGHRELVYRGQLDASRPNRGSSAASTAPLDGKDLRAALEAVLAERPVDDEQRPSIGCNIKWKPGHEPLYFAH